MGKGDQNAVWPLIKTALEVGVGWEENLEAKSLNAVERIWKHTNRLEFKYWLCQLYSWVTLDLLLTFSKSQFTQLQNKDIDNSFAWLCEN